MSYDNDIYRDEAGEPLVDFNEDVQSDQDQHDNFLDNRDDNDAWKQRQREYSPTPVYNESDHKSKTGKLLIKKSSARESTPGFRIVDNDAYSGSTDDDMTRITRDVSDGGGPSLSSRSGGKRKMFEKEISGEKRKEKGEMKLNLRKNGGYSGGSRLKDQEGDQEMKEM